jgi:hypothetical protein
MQKALRKEAPAPAPVQAVRAEPSPLARPAHDFGRVSPFPFREQIQAGFGRHDLGDARAHIADGIAGARALTFGSDVAFDGAPDLHTAAHEAAHVIQQRAGVDAEERHERHADAVADRIVRNQSAETLLDAMPRRAGAPMPVVQPKVTTKFGVFDTEKYANIGTAGKELGVEITLTFNPDRAAVDATKIGLTQSVRSQLGGSAIVLHPSQKDLMVGSGTGEGRRIDRVSQKDITNPMYAAGNTKETDTLGSTRTSSGWGQHGWNYTKDGRPHHRLAKLEDTPALVHAKNASQRFETAALAIEGTQSGTYMGSVEWGWEIDGTGKFSRLPLKLASDATPTEGFIAAAEQWNKATTAGKFKTAADPTDVYGAGWKVVFTVDKDTDVRVGSPSEHGNEIYRGVVFLSGPKKGKTGRVKVADIVDVGGGRATIDLPTK